MSQWQPIETAPKDGSHILAYRLPVGIRVTNNTNPPTVVHWFDDGFYTSVNERAPEYPFNPTHWKPLEPPPRLSPERCEYCSDGNRTGLPGNACENCMNTGLKYPERGEDR